MRSTSTAVVVLTYALTTSRTCAPSGAVVVGGDVTCPSIRYAVDVLHIALVRGNCLHQSLFKLRTGVYSRAERASVYIRLYEPRTTQGI
jgi:hypothetical protein